MNLALVGIRPGFTTFYVTQKPAATAYLEIHPTFFYVQNNF